MNFKKERKKRVNITLNKETLQKAKEHNINISKICEWAINKVVNE